MRNIAICFVLLIVAGSTSADRCDDVAATCALTDLGNNQYEYVFNVTNGSSEMNAIFKWELGLPNTIPMEWMTISFDLPDGWTGDHPGQHLDFMASDNGSGNPYRIYSASVAGCGPTSLEFRWTFWNNGGPDPDCDFSPVGYVFHMQGVDSFCDNVGPSFVCPGPVPVEETTWGVIKEVYR